MTLASSAKTTSGNIRHHALTSGGNFGGNFGAAINAEVKAAIAVNDMVVVGMKQDPFPKKACKALDEAGPKYAYLEYGSYLSQRHRRLALKMWTGWPTIPIVLVKGVLVGGAQDLERLIYGESRGVFGFSSA